MIIIIVLHIHVLPSLKKQKEYNKLITHCCRIKIELNRYCSMTQLQMLSVVWSVRRHRIIKQSLIAIFVCRLENIMYRICAELCAVTSIFR